MRTVCEICETEVRRSYRDYWVHVDAEAAVKAAGIHMLEAVRDVV